MITHSNSIAEIIPAIRAVQEAVDHVAKTSTNPHFGNTYADLNTFLHALRGPMSENDILMTQGPGMENGHVVVDTLLVHSSGEWLRCRSAAPMQKNDPQGVGSAITYLRRYSLAALFAVPQEDDDGNAASGNSRPDDMITCPDCGSGMWDNRVGKKNPNQPDLKCKDKSCDNAIWLQTWHDNIVASMEALEIAPKERDATVKAIASLRPDLLARAEKWVKEKS